MKYSIGKNPNSHLITEKRLKSLELGRVRGLIKKNRRKKGEYNHSEETKKKIKETLKRRFPNGKPINSGCFKKGILKCRTGKSSKSLHKWARELIEKKEGRKLGFNEVVHHINGDWRDNRIENLQLLSRKEHSKLHILNNLGEV